MIIFFFAIRITEDFVNVNTKHVLDVAIQVTEILRVIKRVEIQNFVLALVFYQLRYGNDSGNTALAGAGVDELDELDD